MPDDLVAFIEARLSEDEQTAQAAIVSMSDSGEWTAHHTRGLSKVKERGYYLVASELAAEAADHAARHDPARILREVRAHRRLLDAIFRYEAKIDGEWGCCHSAEAIRSGACPESGDIEALRLLALPYSDHPGFQSEWLIEESSTDG